VTLATIGRQVPASEIGWTRPKAMFGAGVGPAVSDYEAPYRAQSLHAQEVAAFRPPLRSGDFAATVRRDLTLARVQDLVRNDPHVSSALDKLCDHIVGAGLRWSSQPDLAVLLPDRTPSEDERAKARDFARKMEGEFRRFADDPRRFVDSTRRLDFNGLMRLEARTFVTSYEASYALTKQRNPEARYQTSATPVDPDRICNPYGQRDTMTMRLGVEMDDLGAPTAYYVRDAHLGDYWAASEQMSWTKIPRETDWGRPIFVHGYEPQREGDTRGTSPLITLIGKLRMLGRFADNELASATINALFAATIETDMPPEEAAERLRPTGAQVGSQKLYAVEMMEQYDRAPITLGGSRVAMLPPGAKFAMNASPRQTTSFPAFEAAFLQTVASKLGLAYEQLKMDWSKTNYSSARAALNEVWRGMTRLSKVFVTQIVTPLHLAWADEAFDRGYLVEPAGWPKFWEAPGAYLRGKWIGPPRGYVDPVKEMQASSLRIEGLVSTLRDENADQGRDLEETLDQIEAENAMLAARGISRMSLVAVEQSTKGPKQDSLEATGPAGVDGDESGKGASNSASDGAGAGATAALAGMMASLSRDVRYLAIQVSDLAEAGVAAREGTRE
jgi:lambda family phage portal protein